MKLSYFVLMGVFAIILTSYYSSNENLQTFNFHKVFAESNNTIQNFENNTIVVSSDTNPSDTNPSDTNPSDTNPRTLTQVTLTQVTLTQVTLTQVTLTQVTLTQVTLTQVTLTILV
jgi:uncharacterized protein YjbI with pentapeptide repeats